MVIFAFPLLVSSAFSAQTLTYNVNTVISGTTLPSGPAPWLTVTLTEIDTDSVLMNVTSNLRNNEYFSGIGLSLSDSISYSNRSFDSYTSTGGFTTPTVSIGSNIANGGVGEKYDIWFGFETSNSNSGINRFNSDDTFSYTLNGFTINDFNSNNVPIVGHIQSISVVDGTTSAWVSSVPEPSSILLGGLAMLTLFRRRRG